ncbi:MAG TPA: phosphoribosylaminoimidazolesuccinocarboxamide synthase [Firmicutes bacterium]|nr:phosphoribosylaminoimidazolesuccinocarboxamide synthase [Bacillota bacterium]
MANAVVHTDLREFPVRRGKVRDVYDLGRELLIVATDRLSAFDVILAEPIPDKGKILTALSAFWFRLTAADFPNHLISTDISAFPHELQKHRQVLEGRSMLVKKGRVLPVECIVRGYLTGSGWKEYQRSETVNGIKLSAGLEESAKLPEPIFTPTTKAEEGHDLPITYKELENTVGVELAEELRRTSLALFKVGAQKAEESGIIIADTKFEFAILDGELIVVDEIFTPDSSRFWPLAQYTPGKSQPSFDKQYVRDYLTGVNWDYTPPAPSLPAQVIADTRQKYLEAYHLLTGEKLPGVDED